MTKEFDPVWAVRKFIGFSRRYGLRDSVLLVRKNIAAIIRTQVNRHFDRKFNVDTSGIVYLSDLTCEGNNKGHGVWYEPTPLRTLRCMFSLLPSDVSEFVFVDFGSGKGRTLIYGSRFKFKGIIGVEFTRELHDIAARNIRTMRNRSQRCFNLSSICADAATFTLPEENCVLYFFHPFRAEVMRRVLDNIRQSYLRRPRKLIILYYHPQLNDVIEELDIIRKTAEMTMPLDVTAEPSLYRRKLAVYETMASSAALPVTAEVSR